MTPAATRLRAEVARIYGDTEKASRLTALASVAARLLSRGDEADRLLHASAMQSATIASRGTEAPSTLD